MLSYYNLPKQNQLLVETRRLVETIEDSTNASFMPTTRVTRLWRMSFIQDQAVFKSKIPSELDINTVKQDTVSPKVGGEHQFIAQGASSYAITFACTQLQTEKESSGGTGSSRLYSRSRKSHDESRLPAAKKQK